jgi:hypothetical protein
MQGYQGASAIRNDMQQQEQQRQAALAQQQMQADLNAASQDHRLLPGVMVKYPQLADKLKHGWDVLSGEQQRNTLNQATDVYAALRAGRSDVAITRMKEQAAAMRNGGDEQGAKRLEDMARIGELDPQFLTDTIATTLAALPGGDKVIEGVAKLGDESRKAEKAPAELRKAEAEATGAEAEAKTKQTTAKYAEKTALESLRKAAADIGLTNAQTQQALAATKKLSEETKQIIADAAAGGDPGKRFEAEQKLRKEYSDQTKGYVEVTESHRRMKAAADDGAGDIALIYSYMKMLDPGSVVREGEFATAQNSAGIPSAISNLYNKAISGERLTAGQRKTFLGQANRLADAASKREAEVRDGLTNVVKSYRLNPDNVFGSGARRDPGDAWAAGGQKPTPTKTAAGATVSGW